jgi:hypothetical protein
MYYFVYKTTNNINGKYYIGCHKTNDIDDGYFGSGKNIVKAIQKYGKDIFTREILFMCSSEDEMYEKEKNIVNETIVNDDNSYNLKVGGSSNFYYVNKNGLNHKSNQNLKHSEKLKSDPEYAKHFSEKMSMIMKSKPRIISDKQRESSRNNMIQLNEKRKNNRKHSAETKAKIAAAIKKKWDDSKIG